MKLINKSSNVSLILQAKNTSGGVLNLTGAEITVNFKQYGTDTTNLFTKRNTAAGGSDSEVEIIDAALGFYKIKILSANTSALTIRTLHVGITITISSTDYTDSLFLKIIENKGTGIPVDNVILQPYKKIVWTMVNGGTPTLVLKAGFDGTPTATISGSTVTLTSAALEFEATGNIFSNFQDYHIGTSNTQTIQIVYDSSIAARTVVFGFADETKVFISDSASYDPTTIVTSDFLSKGTTAERTAKGATLSSGDVFIWMDTDDNSPYFWNGSGWK